MDLQQKFAHRFIYKIESKILKKANWNIELPIKDVMREHPDYIVSLNSSECLRFIDNINGVEDISEKVRQIQKTIRAIKKKPKSPENKRMISNNYERLYNLQFQKDYICVIMNSESDYDRANKGFQISFGGSDIVKYRRFLGTNGGIKNSTIVYVNEKIYPELKRRLDNGRDLTKALVPAKLEAYQALLCSGSIPLPDPKGFIVVKDCITHFKENVILIDDSEDGEPRLTSETDYEIDHNNSDGYGFMLPSYSRTVNQYLTGDENAGTIAGMNTRYSFEKGMIYTFDFVEFAEKVAGTYYIEDVWGTLRDVRDAEVILTESMLKLWDSYKSWEDYYENCRSNGYSFCVAKTTPDKLENVRDTNYQFLQSYNFTDEEIKELCQPTIDEIKDVIGLDYRKSLTFLSGFSLNDDIVLKTMSEDSDMLHEYDVKALMADRRVINDPFIRRKIYYQIQNRIMCGERGSIRIHANFQMISGDLYALAQSMFGLEVTGLLKAGEVYSKYWIDAGADEVACFRAPMTCHNNIRRRKLCKTEEALQWFKYIDTALIYNAWDSTCEALNGADFDGDTNMVTDNPIIVRNTKNSETIICVQKKADKVVPTEEDIIMANKLAFNDDIGTITNRITSMIEIQSGYEPGSPEYEILEYRIRCGQLLQQNSIDRAKGIISKQMPVEWYSLHDCVPQEEDDYSTIARKNQNYKIAAFRKPYFMTYVYPKLKQENDTYIKNNNLGAIRRFFEYGIGGIDDLAAYKDKTPEMIEYYNFYKKLLPVGYNPCIVNRISWYFEESFKNIMPKISKLLTDTEFDYSILKSGVAYSKASYSRIEQIYQEYLRRLDKFQMQRKTERIEPYENNVRHQMLADWFRSECEKVCPNEKELCDIVLDLCYRKNGSKQFSWDICGEIIVDNLLDKNGYKISYPRQVEEDEEFEYCGMKFRMETIMVNDNDSSE